MGGGCMGGMYVLVGPLGSCWVNLTMPLIRSLFTVHTALLVFDILSYIGEKEEEEGKMRRAIVRERKMGVPPTLLRCNLEKDRKGEVFACSKI